MVEEFLIYSFKSALQSERQYELIMRRVCNTGTWYDMGTCNVTSMAVLGRESIDTDVMFRM